MSISKSQLPSTFTYAQARDAGVSKHTLYRWRSEGQIEPLSRGLYRRTDRVVTELELIEIAKKAPLATLCLTSALVRYGLSDDIPKAIDVALPRGTRAPVTAAPVSWHHFELSTFEVGRKVLRLDTRSSIALYSAERCIIDAFRTRAHGGHELANDALKRWLRQKDTNPGSLLKMAASFPRALAPLRKALEILL